MTAETIDRQPSRVPIGILVLAVVFPSLVTLIYFVWLARETSGWQQVAYGVGKSLQFALPVIWIAGVQRQPVRPTPIGRSGIGVGFVFGSVIVIAMCLLYFLWLKPAGMFDVAAEQIVAKVHGFHIRSAWAYLGLAAFYALIHSGLEEYYWRWFVFGQLRHLVSPFSAAIISSLGFMAHHVILLGTFFGWSSFLTYFFSLSVAVGGLFWAWLYHRTRSIYAPWASHLMVDAGIFLVGYDIVRGTFG